MHPSTAFYEPEPLSNGHNHRAIDSGTEEETIMSRVPVKMEPLSNSSKIDQLTNLVRTDSEFERVARPPEGKFPYDPDPLLSRWQRNIFCRVCRNCNSQECLRYCSALSSIQATGQKMHAWRALQREPSMTGKMELISTQIYLASLEQKQQTHQLAVVEKNQSRMYRVLADTNDEIHKLFLIQLREGAAQDRPELSSSNLDPDPGGGRSGGRRGGRGSSSRGSFPRRRHDSGYATSGTTPPSPGHPGLHLPRHHHPKVTIPKRSKRSKARKRFTGKNPVGRKKQSAGRNMPVQGIVPSSQNAPTMTAKDFTDLRFQYGVPPTSGLCSGFY
jgi:hypothetical protein